MEGKEEGGVEERRPGLEATVRYICLLTYII